MGWWMDRTVFQWLGSRVGSLRCWNVQFIGMLCVMVSVIGSSLSALLSFSFCGGVVCWFTV